MDVYSKGGTDIRDYVREFMIALSRDIYGRGFSHCLAVVGPAEEILKYSIQTMNPDELYPLMGLDPGLMSNRRLSIYDPDIVHALKEGMRIGKNKQDVDNSFIIDEDGVFLDGVFYMDMNGREVRPEDLSRTGRASMRWISSKVDGASGIMKRTQGNVLEYRGGKLFREAYYDETGRDDEDVRMFMKELDENGVRVTPIEFERDDLIYTPKKKKGVLHDTVVEQQVAVSA